MYLLTVPFVKNRHVLAENYFIFLKNDRKQSWKAFNVKLGPQWKNWKSSYQVKQISTLFCKLVALNLG